MELLCKPEYEAAIAATRDQRMEWWRGARFGMFVHYGLFSVLGHHEWAMLMDEIPVAEYEKLADQFQPKPGAAYEWAALAKKAGMKYMVMTTRHHEGFSLWDSKANPYNSVNYGPKRDLVREFVDACREYGLKIGFYSTLMEWHHPDSWACAYDPEARRRYTDYIKAINRELLTNYGKIDILWYDVASPMTSWEGWDSLALNQMCRELQPDIIINNRSLLDEDFGTPEGSIVADSARDWEACMTFNDMSWGYLDSEQAAPYSYNAPRILRMLNTVAAKKGNLLLNIGPAPDGSVPSEAVEPLETVGKWLQENGDAVYGIHDFTDTGMGIKSFSQTGNKVFCWVWIWPKDGILTIGGYSTKLRSAKLLKTGEPVSFRQEGRRIILEKLPGKSPDTHANVGVIELDFEDIPECTFGYNYPQWNKGYGFLPKK